MSGRLRTIAEKRGAPSEKRRRFGSTIVLRNKIGLPYGYQVCIQCSFDCLGAFLTTLNLTLDWVLPSLIHYCSRHAVILAWLILLRMHFPFYSISSLPWGLCNLNFEMMLEACSPVHSSPTNLFPPHKACNKSRNMASASCVWRPSLGCSHGRSSVKAGLIWFDRRHFLRLRDSTGQLTMGLQTFNESTGGKLTIGVEFKESEKEGRWGGWGGLRGELEER